MGRRGGRADARGPRPPRQEPGAVDRDRRLAERPLGAAEGRARRRRQQEGQGHQAPRPHLLVRPRPRVSAANLHDTHGLEPLLDRAAEAGWDLRRIKGDAIYAGPTVRAAAERHAVELQVSLRPPAARGFAPLPVRWRIEATFGTLRDRYRRLTRNLEQSPEAAENVVEVANLRRVLRVLTRPA